MQIEKRQSDNIHIIDIIGSLDLYHASELKDAIHEMLASNIAGLILNFAQVEYIDSTGIGVLVYSNSFLKSNNTPLRLVQIHGSVRRVIELTKLIGYLPIADTEDAAIQQINAEE